LSISVSAILPVFNTDHRLREAIDSVLAQTRPAQEVLVVDDGSTDPETLAILDSYKGKITLIRQANSGVSAARNRAASHATGDWLAFLDSDDEWLPDKLEMQVAEIARTPGAALCYGSIVHCGIDGVRELRRARQPHELWPGFRLGNQFPPSATMIRRDIFEACGGFKIGLAEDWELFIRVAYSHPLCCVMKPVVIYNESWSSISLDPAAMLPSTLAIIDSLLIGISSPVSRWYWRRKIQGSIWRKASVGYRARGESGLSCLLRSLLHDPTPDLRYKTLALELASAAFGMQLSRQGQREVERR